MLVLQGPLRHLSPDQRDAALDAMLDTVSRGLT
jgi:hypothetical protein